jgi:tripartite-type tricarboxylate transporter receptor subunit TctC
VIEGYSGVAGAARSGSIKLIAVASAKRLAEFPDVPKRFQVSKPLAGPSW